MYAALTSRITREHTRRYAWVLIGGRSNMHLKAWHDLKTHRKPRPWNRGLTISNPGSRGLSYMLVPLDIGAPQISHSDSNSMTRSAPRAIHT